jgi:hypothetical protein
MSSILNDLGLDEETFSWYDLAACKGMDTNLFFDKYEIDINIANSVDSACLSCPVSKICYENGVANNDHGVWGGIYLNSGSIDKSKNIHKTQETWKAMRKKNDIH